MRPTLKIRRVTTKRLVWREFTIRVRYTYQVHSQRRFNGTEFRGRTYIDHVEIDVVAAPPRATCPLTTTGYRSFYLPTDDLRRAGGPRAYITRLLDEHALDRDWIKRDAASRQGDLFGMPSNKRTAGSRGPATTFAKTSWNGESQNARSQRVSRIYVGEIVGEDFTKAK